MDIKEDKAKAPLSKDELDLLALKTTARRDWTKFLKLWIKSSKLFHSDFPAHFHNLHYKLRIRLLSKAIYQYLFEKASIHQWLASEGLQEDDQDKDQEDASSDDGVDRRDEWMVGHYYPSQNLFDPMSKGYAKMEAYSFSLRGIRLFPNF